MKPIVVVGSSNTDLVAGVERLPGEGETVQGTSLNKFSGGKGANQAVAAVRAGAQVAFAGALGTDAFGDETVAAFEADGLDLRFLRRTDQAPSGTALISVDRNGANQIVVVLPLQPGVAPQASETRLGDGAGGVPRRAGAR